MKIRILILVLALLMGMVGAALADGDVVLRQWVLGGGASASAAGDVTLRATLGEPVVGDISGGDVTVGQGFWRGGSLPEGGVAIYLPLIQR